MAEVERGRPAAPAGAGVGSADGVQDLATRKLLQELIAAQAQTAALVARLAGNEAIATSDDGTVRQFEAVTKISPEGKVWKRRFSITPKGGLVWRSEEIPMGRIRATATTTTSSAGTTTPDEGSVTMPQHEHQGAYDGGPLAGPAGGA